MDMSHTLLKTQPNRFGALRPRDLIIWGVFAAVMVVAPWLFTSSLAVTMLSQIGIAIVACLSKLRQALFTAAQLPGALFGGADLYQTHFAAAANIVGGDFRGAELTYADFRHRHQKLYLDILGE